MALCIGKVQRTRACGDGADKALPQTQLRQVDRLRVQTFGGIEFENAVSAKHVEGADFRDHILRDFTNDPVKARLRLKRLSHQFAQPLQQHAGTGCLIAHDRRTLLLCSFGTEVKRLSVRTAANKEKTALLAPYYRKPFGLVARFRRPIPITRPRRVTPTPL
jgi:hypothetical protein